MTAKTYHIGVHAFDAPTLEPALYLVATPIGNLGDISIRALQTLAACDIIYCEDTRITGVLLHRYSIRNAMKNYHEHNAAKARPDIIAFLQDGKSVALVSDAGTPLISDPGYKLVVACAAEGLAGHRRFLQACSFRPSPPTGFPSWDSCRRKNHSG
jgi:16S rRNA (cytidine1402-2'-O)-methyltransferase